NAPGYGARAGGSPERYTSQDEGEGCHKNRPQTQLGSYECSFLGGFTLVVLHLGELHDQNGILGGEADEHDQSNLGISVVVQLAHPQEGERTKDGNRSS